MQLGFMLCVISVIIQLTNGELTTGSVDSISSYQSSTEMSKLRYVLKRVLQQLFDLQTGVTEVIRATQAEDEKILSEIKSAVSNCTGPINTQSTRSNNEQRCDCEELTIRQTETTQTLAKILAELAEIKSTCNLTTQQQQTKPVCPPDFTYVSAVNGCYKVLLENLEWSAAGVRCRSLHKDAHLVIISSQQEQDAVASILRGYTDSAFASAGCWYYDSSHGYGFWTAGQRIDPSRASGFIYRVTGESGNNAERLTSMDYTNWWPGEPNYGAGGLTESCMHLFQGMNYKWNDYQCNKPVCSVCEIDL